MNLSTLRFIQMPCLILILLLSCNTKKSEPIAKGPQIVEYDGPSVEEESYEASSQDNTNVTVRANYSTVGPLIPNPIYITQEITYKNGEVIRDKNMTKTNGFNMTITQEYDNKSRLKSINTEQNGKPYVSQINEYTDDDLLLSELRLEKNSIGYDTFYFEYHYPNDRPNPMHYYRTNNGTKVTEMKLTTNGNKEILEERAVGSTDYVGISIIKRTKNKEGKVVEEQETSMSSDWQDKTKIDTTVNEPTYFEYDEKGRLVRQESYGALSVNGVIESFYSDDGTIKKKIITKKGKPKKTIIFKKI